MPSTARLDLVEQAICAGYRGQIEWSLSCLERFRNDPAMKSFTERGVKDLLCDSVRQKRARLQARSETDPDWLKENPSDPWWYFAVIPVPEFPKGLFVKMKLLWDEGDREDDAFVQIVSIHEEL
jgi:hypothetical protein